MRSRLMRLRLRGFRSFVVETTIDFPENGLLLVRGKNHDTGGSSGSGKTTVLLALQYALGLCHLPATSLQSWLTTEPMFVELTLRCEDREVVITRKPGLTVECGDLKLKGRNAEESLESILGLSPGILEALTYRRQRTQGQFLSKTDGEKKEFLTTVLGLEKFEAAAEKSQRAISDQEPVVEACRVTALADAAEVDRLKAIVGDPLLVDEIPIRKAISDATVRVETLTVSLQKLKTEFGAQEVAIRAEAEKIRLSYMPRL